MSLRMRVVEAGARAACEANYPNWGNVWDEVGAGVEGARWRDTAEVVLDAALDCLTENADEWVEGAGRLVLTTDSIYEALIVILREPTDG